MTTTSLPARLGPTHQLLDSTIRTNLDRLDIAPGQAVLEVGAGPGEITARLATLVGPDGSVTAVDADTSHLAPTHIIDIYRRDPNRDLLPGTTDSYDHIVARWHGALRDPVDVVQQMIARLRPGGTLALATITPTPPRIYRAPDTEDAHLISNVMHHLRRALVGPEGAGTWTNDIESLLLESGMAGHCVHTSAETWTGNRTGCRLLADIVTHLRPTLTEITDSDINRLRALMADPRVLLASYERQFIHARKAV